MNSSSGLRPLPVFTPVLIRSVFQRIALIPECSAVASRQFDAFRRTPWFMPDLPFSAGCCTHQRKDVRRHPAAARSAHLRQARVCPKAPFGARPRWQLLARGGPALNKASSSPPQHLHVTSFGPPRPLAPLSTHGRCGSKVWEFSLPPFPRKQARARCRFLCGGALSPRDRRSGDPATGCSGRSVQ